FPLHPRQIIGSRHHVLKYTGMHQTASQLLPGCYPPTLTRPWSTPSGIGCRKPSRPPWRRWPRPPPASDIKEGEGTAPSLMCHLSPRVGAEKTEETQPDDRVHPLLRPLQGPDRRWPRRAQAGVWISSGRLAYRHWHGSVYDRSVHRMPEGLDGIPEGRRPGELKPCRPLLTRREGGEGAGLPLARRQV